jgi:hypothetical protein
MRLCLWDGDLSDVQDAEIRLHGIYAQLENRFIAITHFLHLVTSANVATVKFAKDERNARLALMPPSRSVSTESSNSLERKENEFDRGDDPDNEKVDDNASVSDSGRQNGLPQIEPSDTSKVAKLDATVELKLANLLKKATMCVTYSILVLASAASIVWRMCGDTLSAASCIRACNNFLPTLIENVSDPSILQQFMQRHLDLMTSTILYSANSQMLGSGFGVLGPSIDGGRNFVFSRYKPSKLGITGSESIDSSRSDEPEPEVPLNASNQWHTELRLLAFSLGGEIVKQSRRCFASFPRFLTGI